MKMLRNFAILSILFVISSLAERPLEDSDGNSNDLILRADLDEFNYRLPNNTRPLHYDITLATNIDRKEFNFTGIVRIELRALEDTNRITLHARQIVVTSFELTDASGQQIQAQGNNYDVRREFLSFTTTDTSLKANQNYFLTIHYTSELRQDLGGFYRTSYINSSGKKKWLATTQFESTDARHAFPCYDEPSLKAYFTIRIKHGASYHAVSNMPETRQNNDDGSVMTEFQKTPLMSTYLIAFMVSDFEYKENKMSFDGTTFRHRVFAKPTEVKNTGYALDEGEHILNAIANYVQIYFSLPKMDQAAIPEFRAGAMENWGLVTYREEYLLFKPNKHLYSRQTSITTIISHEFGHQWFGNLVSPKWWNFIWLNEGFATLFEHIGTDLVHPDWNIFDQFVVSTLQKVLRSDALPKTRSMNHYVDSPNGIGALFDYIAYQKSGSVLRMFLHAFGEKTFQKGLKYYLGNSSYKAADENDLFSSLDAAAKEDKTLDTKLMVKEIFGSWSNQRGFPLLTVNRNYKNGSLTLCQEKYDEMYPSTEVFLGTWWIPYNFATSTENIFDKTTPIGWMNTRTKLIEPTEFWKWSNNDWLVFNRQQTGYYRILYDEQNYKLITNELNSGNISRIHPLNRAQIIDDLNDFVRTGRLPYQIFFDLIIYLKNETKYAPWASARYAINEMKRNLAASEKQHHFTMFIAPLIEPFYKLIALNVTENEPHFNKYAREIAVNLACDFGVALCLNESYDEFKKFLQSGKTISQHNRGLIIKNGIRTATENEIDQLWKQFLKSKNLDVRKEILSSIPNIQNATIMEWYLNQTINKTNEDEFSKTERYSLLTAEVDSNQDGLLRVVRLLAINLKKVEKRIGNSKSLLKYIAARILTSDVRDEFVKLLKVAKSMDLCDDDDIKTIKSIIDEKLKWLDVHQKKIESCIPNFDSGSSSYLLVSPAIVLLLLISNIFVLC